MQKIYNFYNCFDTIQGRLYRSSAPSGTAYTVSTDTRLVPSSLTGTGDSVFVSFSNQLSIPFPVGTTVALTGVTTYSGTYSVTTASITGSIATIGWSSSAIGAASLSSSEIKFAPENNLILSSIAGLTAGMLVVGTGVTASTTISSIQTSSNMIVLSQTNLSKILSGQYFYIGKNTLINTSTPLDCLNVYKRKVISSGLTGDPTTDTITQLQNSFNEALNQSPNSEEVQIVEDITNQRRLALITQEKDPMWNEDIKRIALPFATVVDVGNTVDWIRTGYKYLIMTQDLTQKAYFSGTMHQCNFLLKWKDGSTIYSQYVVVNGPSEKDDGYVKRQNITIDEVDSKISIFIGKTTGTDVLKRYNRIILNGKSWEIVVINDMENSNILQISFKENFINNDIDDLVNDVADNTEENVVELQSLILNDLS